MSERLDVPSKRPKPESDQYFRPSGRPQSFNDSGQVAILEGKLEAKRSEISELKSTVEQLKKEQTGLETVLARVNGAWVKMLGDIESVAPQHSFEQEVLSTLPVASKDEDLLTTLDKHRKTLRDRVRKLVEAGKHELQSSEPMPTNVLFPQYRKVISEFASRTVQLELQCRSLQRAREDAERNCEQLRSELTAALTRNRQQRPKLKDGDDPTKPYRDDVLKLKGELESVNRARAAIEEQMGKLYAELRVSEERFTTSRSFQRLAKSVQSLIGKIGQLNAENGELRKMQDEVEDRIFAEVQKTRRQEEAKRDSLEKSYSELLRRFEKECQEKQSIAAELDTLRRLQSHSSRLKDTEALLTQREAEVDSLKKRLKEYKVAKEELDGKAAASAQQVTELQQSVVEKDAQISDLQSQLLSLNHHSPSDSAQNPIQHRLIQYRDEQVKLRETVRKLESDLTAAKNKLNHAQAKLVSEKSNTRKLTEDLENFEKAYEQAMRQNKALNQQAKSQESKIAELAVARHAEDHNQSLIHSELQLTQERITTQSGVITAQQGVIQALENEKSGLESSLKSLQNALKDMENRLKDAEKHLGTDLRSHDLIEDIKQQAADRCRSLEKQLIAGSTEAAQLRFAVSQGEQQVAALTTELEQLKSAESPQREERLLSELLQLREMVECGGCRKRLKSVVLTCLHCFCRDCADSCGGECPRCKQRSAPQDVKAVSWE